MERHRIKPGCALIGRPIRKPGRPRVHPPVRPPVHPLWRGLLALALTMASTITPTGAAVAGLQWSVTPAWDGNWRPGAATEISVRLIADSGGPVRIVVEGDVQTITRTFLEPDESYSVTIPVRPDQAAINLRIHFDSRDKIEHTVELHPRAGRIAAIVSSTLDEKPRADSTGAENLTRIPVSVSALPRTAGAYENVDLLALDSRLVGRLDEQQSTALERFAANCGQLLIDGPMPAGPAFPPAQGACAAGELPGPRELRELATETSGIKPLVFFFAAYVLILCALATTQRKVAILGVPLLAVSLLIAVAWEQPAEREFIFWAELDSGDRTARYAALLDVRGRGPGQFQYALPAELGLPLTLSTITPVELDFRPDQSAHVLTVHPRLLSRHQFAFSNTIDIVSPLTLSLRDEKPWIQNNSDRPSPAATLAWQGHYFSVPTLESGTGWSPAIDAPPIAAGNVPALLRTRTFDHTAVLLDLAAGQIPATGAETVNAWLLLRPEISGLRS